MGIVWSAGLRVHGFLDVFSKSWKIVRVAVRARKRMKLAGAEKAKRSQCLIDRAPRHLFLFDQVEEKGLNLFLAQTIRRTVVVQADPNQPVDVALDRPIRVMTQFQGVDGLFAQGCAHGLLLIQPDLPHEDHRGLERITQCVEKCASLTRSGLVQQLFYDSHLAKSSGKRG